MTLSLRKQLQLQSTNMETLFIYYQIAPVLFHTLSAQHQPSAAFVLISGYTTPQSLTSACLTQPWAYEIAYAFLATLTKFYFLIKLNL